MAGSEGKEEPHTTVVYVTSTASSDPSEQTTVVYITSTVHNEITTSATFTSSLTASTAGNPNGDTTGEAGVATPSSAKNSGTSSDGSGLSAGAAVGIGTGVTLAVVLLVALAWFMFRRKRKNRKIAANLPTQSTPVPEVPYVVRKHELPATEPTRPAELDNDGQKHELNGHGNGRGQGNLK